MEISEPSPCQGGGSAFGSEHNTCILYSGVITDSQDDKPLDSVKYPFFDKLHMVYLYNKMKKGEAVPTTKVRHDYILAFEDILFIVHLAHLLRKNLSRSSCHLSK